MAIWIWIAVISISMALEFATAQGVAVWSACAGVVSLVLAICKVDYGWQIGAFLIVDIVLVLFVRKYTRAFFSRLHGRNLAHNTPKQKTNIKKGSK